MVRSIRRRQLRLPDRQGDVAGRGAARWQYRRRASAIEPAQLPDVWLRATNNPALDLAIPHMSPYRRASASGRRHHLQDREMSGRADPPTHVARVQITKELFGCLSHERQRICALRSQLPLRAAHGFSCGDQTSPSPYCAPLLTPLCRLPVVPLCRTKAPRTAEQCGAWLGAQI